MNLYEVRVKVSGQYRVYIVAASGTMYAESKIREHVPGAFVIGSRPRGPFVLEHVEYGVRNVENASER